MHNVIDLLVPVLVAAIIAAVPITIGYFFYASGVSTNKYLIEVSNACIAKGGSPANDRGYMSCNYGNYRGNPEAR